MMAAQTRDFETATPIDFDIKSVSGITADSRQVKSGFLFTALPGTTVDGAAFIGDAIKNGAAAILIDENVVLPDNIPAHTHILRSSNPRQHFAKLTAAFYGHRQPEHTYAVTGTNGKTSIAWFVHNIWSALGHTSRALGTLGLIGDKSEEKLNTEYAASMTTLDTVTLHETLSNLVDQDVSHLIMEASSHGLDQYRMDGVRVRAAAFTNLSHDHLDYHKNMNAYRAAKLRLFSELMDENGTAVLNRDIDEFEEITAQLKNQTVITYGTHKESDLRLVNRTPKPDGQDVTFEIFGLTYDLHLPLIGDFQAMNMLCAIGLICAEDKTRIQEIMNSITNLPCVPGRLEGISGHPKNAGVYVDYAHTPDALKTALQTMHEHTKNKLICVFGCGGDRDTKKRPIMGGIAARYAEKVFITDDNPRSEDPAAIRAAIMAECPEALEIGDRADAIQTAINELNTGDCLLIAGKGHEQGQITGQTLRPFDDRTEAQKAIKALIENGGGTA